MYGQRYISLCGFCIDSGTPDGSVVICLGIWLEEVFFI